MKAEARHDIESWLAAALDHLAAEGKADFRIDHLCTALGVTKGSFYWHFENRADFVAKLADYWVEYSNAQVIRALQASHADAGTKLRQIMNVVIGQDICRFEIAVRAAAVKEPLFAKAVEKVDEQRYRYVRRFLRELGFSGDELTVRSRIFVTFMSFERAGTKVPPMKERLRQIEPLFEILVGR